MKGVSNILILILLAMLSVSITYMVYVFLIETTSSTTQSGTQITDSALSSFSSCIRIESVSGNKAFLRNCGEGVVTQSSLGMYMDEIALSFIMSPASISEDSTATVTLTSLASVDIGMHTLRATSPKASGQITVEAYGSPVSLRTVD